MTGALSSNTACRPRSPFETPAEGWDHLGNDGVTQLAAGDEGDDCHGANLGGGSCLGHPIAGAAILRCAKQRSAAWPTE